MNYTVAIKEIEDGWYMGQCEQIPGAITQGKTIEEVRENIKEAITLILECERDHFRQVHSGEQFISREVAFA